MFPQSWEIRNNVNRFFSILNTKSMTIESLNQIRVCFEKLPKTKAIFILLMMEASMGFLKFKISKHNAREVV